MSLDFHDPEDLMRQAQQAAGKRLLRAALYFVQYHQQKTGLSAEPYTRTRTRTTSRGPKGSTYTDYARPSRPGEYPRKRTGGGQANILYDPPTPAGAGAEGKVRIGARNLQLIGNPPLPHMLFLESKRDRLGFRQSAADLKDQIRALLEAAA